MKQKQGFLNHRCWWSLPSRTSFDLATSCRFWLSWLCLDIQGMMHSFYQGVASLDEKCGVFIIRGPCWTKLCCFISWFSSRKQRVQRKRTEIHRIHPAVMKYSNQRNSFEHPSGYFWAARILRQKPTYMQRLRKMVKRMRASWTAGSETWEHWVFIFVHARNDGSGDLGTRKGIADGHWLLTIPVGDMSGVYRNLDPSKCSVTVCPLSLSSPVLFEIPHWAALGSGNPLRPPS